MRARATPEARFIASRVAALLGVAGLIFAVMLGLGWLLTHLAPGSGLGAVDIGIDVWLAEHRTPELNVVSEIATNACSTTNVFLLGLLGAAASVAVLRRLWPLLVLVVALVGELGLFLATAILVGRPRPPVAHVDAALPPTSSFPSGHTGAAICLFGGLAAIVWCTARARWGWLAVGLAVVAVVAVAAARMYRGAHYLTDAGGAVVLALPWLLVTVWAVRGLLHADVEPAREVARRDEPRH